MPQDPNMQPQQAPPGQPAPPAGQPTDGPQDKDIYEMMVANAQNFIHSEANSDRIIQAMGQGDPAQVAGQQSAIVLNGIVESAASKGITPSPEAAIAAAAAVISEIVDLAVAAGVIEGVPVEDKEFQTTAMQSFRETLGITEAPEQEQPPMQEAPMAEAPAQEQQPGAGVLGRAGGM